MDALKPEQKDALAKAFTGFLEDFAEESVPEGMESEDSEDMASEDMPMKKKKGKGMAKYMEQM
jgi:hypothetical protein